MKTVDIDEAKTHLAELIKRVEMGEPFVIARVCKPAAKVIPIEQTDAKPFTRTGGMEGQIVIPDDFKAFGREEIEEIFGLNEDVS